MSLGRSSITEAQSGEISVGIDFGTTNSSVAWGKDPAQIELVSFPAAAALTESFRSVLYLEQHKRVGRTQVKSFTGPSAIEEYLGVGSRPDLDGVSVGRLIQSLKSYLPSRTLTGTEVFGRRYTVEDLISRILADLRLQAEKRVGQPIRRATVGRPVRFVGAETEEDDAFAVTRLRESFRLAGFETIEFEMEPIAAAYAYESRLDHDELILIGDFGGGTSDFSLLHAGPGVRRRGRTPQDLLGNSGLGLAGDAFDARIVRRLVSPALGSDSYERSGKLIPAVPAWIYANLERWHYLSFLKTRNVAEILKSARMRAMEPEKIEALIELIDEDLGYQLHQAVQRLKVELSHEESARFRFRDRGMNLETTVRRVEFEGWIIDELRAIEACIDGLLKTSGVDRGSVDRVFLTGGTSFVPAVRRIFERRFGAERVRAGNEFTSVARGLALRDIERHSAGS